MRKGLLLVSVVQRLGHTRSSNPQATARFFSHGSPDASNNSTLSQSWPAIVRRFNTLKNDDGFFPLFPQNAEQKRLIKKDREAAVFVMLCSVDQEPALLFTKRGSNLNQHAAEISFPGGHFEDEVDKDLVQTALRETQEELEPSPPSLISHQVEILGKAAKLPSLRGTPVTPVLGVLWHDLSKSNLQNVFPGSPGEVDVVFTVSVKELLQSETSRELPENRFKLRHGPVFPTEHGNIWGLTAYILRPLLHNLLKPVLSHGRSAR